MLPTIHIYKMSWNFIGPESANAYRSARRETYAQKYGAPYANAYSNIPKGAIPLKKAVWYSYPNPADGGKTMTLGLGRYRRYGRGRRAAPRRRRVARRKVVRRKTRKVRRVAAPRRRRATRRSYRRAPARRRVSRYRYGRGGYFGDLLSSIKSGVEDAYEDVTHPGNFLGDVGSRIGSWLGGGSGTLGNIGGSAGRYLGNAMGNLAGAGNVSAARNLLCGTGKYRRRTGLGAYDDPGASFSALSNIPSMNAAQNALQDAATMKQDIPLIVNVSEGEVTIRNREYVGDITSRGNAFNLSKKITLNPGISPEEGGAFPWLSGIARHFQQYRFEGLTYEFVSTSGVSSVSQALGEVIIATNYNVTDPAPVNKQQMVSQAFSVTRSPFTLVKFVESRSTT